MGSIYLGQILQGGWNFAPRGSAMCNGQILSIQQNSALFALLGTTYGGNGTSNFGLPDLQGRSMIHWGTSTTGTTYVIGEVSGVENTTMLISNMPAHTHTATFTSTSTLNAAASPPKATTSAPAAGSVLGHAVDLSNVGSLPAIYCPAGTATPIALAGLNVAGNVTLAISGGNQPFAILNPYTCVTAVIALQGIFPSRN